MQLEQVVQYSPNKYRLSNIRMNCVYFIKMMAYIIFRSETLVEGTIGPFHRKGSTSSGADYD